MKNKVRVWDLPVRFFHWSLAILFVFMILSVKVFDNMMEWHMRAGYAMISLIVFRILWGIVGSYYARFSQFIYSPVRSVRYAFQIITGKAEHYLGHNPAGGWMVVVLILGIGLQGLTGLFISDEILWDAPFYGVLSDELTSLAGTIHFNLEFYLQIFVGFHIAAVLWHRFRYQDPLIGAMLHGDKPTSGQSDVVESKTPWIAFFICFAIALSLFVWLWSKPI
jgi:cytochrome b